MRTKNLFILAIMLSFLGCRSYYDITQNEKTTESAKKFAIFQNKINNSFYSKGADSFDYSNVFAYMSQRYDSINSTNITGLVNTTNIVRHNVDKKQNYIVTNNEAYIDFRFHSVVIEYDNGDLVMIFPKINNSKVVDLVVAVLGENQTKLHYRSISKDNEVYNQNIQDFQQVISAKKSNNLGSSNSTNGVFSKGGETDIEEVVIIRRRHNTIYWTNGGGGEGGDEGGGGCARYNNCDQEAPPGDGGGGNANGDENNNGDPCAQSEAIDNNANLKPAITNLKSFALTAQDDEIGFKFNKDGSVTPADSNGKHHVTFSDPSTMNGGYHNHTLSGIHMFSAHDISTLIEITRYQNIGHTGDAF